MMQESPDDNLDLDVDAGVDEPLLDDLRVVLERRTQQHAATPPTSEPAPGWRLAQYEVRELLGTGGMARVYQAVDTVNGREVALKVLKRELQASPDICARFEQEARSMSRIEHENVVRVFDSPTEHGSTAIAMELLTGGSLRNLLRMGSKRRKQMGIRALTRFAEQTARGLGAAHASGIVHRDIKPSNLMLDADGTVKVADFGIVLALERATWLTGLGRPIGTPAYMSPEQCKGKRVAAASDIYAFGVTMFELATGQRPFTEEAESPFALMLKHIRQRPPDPRRIRPDLPGWFSRVLLKCLEKDPARRFADGESLAEAIVAGPHTEDTGDAETEEPRSSSRLDTAAIREQLKRLPQRAIVAWACRCARRALLLNDDPRLGRSIESAEATLGESGSSIGSIALSHALLRIQQLRSTSFSVVDTALAAPAGNSAAHAALAAAATCACAAARCAADAAGDAAYVAEEAMSAHAAAGRSVSEVWSAAQRDYQLLLAAKLGAEGTSAAPSRPTSGDRVRTPNAEVADKLCQEPIATSPPLLAKTF